MRTLFGTRQVQRNPPKSLNTYRRTPILRHPESRPSILGCSVPKLRTPGKWPARALLSFGFLRPVRTVINLRVCGERVGDGQGAMAAGETRIARRYYVSGMVQGVGYRFFVQRVAGRLNLQGYAKNLRNGRVEVYAIGEPASQAALLAELERGPSFSNVTDVAEQDAEVEEQYASAFSIEHDSW